MKISAIGTKNIYFGKNDKTSDIRKFLPSKKSAVLCVALLTSANINEPKDSFQNSIETNIPKVILKTDEKAKPNENELNWEEIPDYQKFLGLFYSSLVLMVLVNLFSTKEKDNHQDINKY